MGDHAFTSLLHASGHPARHRTIARGVARAQIKPKTRMQFGQSANAWKDHRTEGDLKDDVLGPVFEGDQPYVVDDSFDNFMAAVNKRINYSTELEADDEIIKAAQDFLDEKIPNVLSTVEWTYDLFEEWNEAVNPPAKRAAMEAAVSYFHRFTDKEFGKKDLITKVELLLKRHKYGEWAGRLVNASTDLHNALSGPLLWKALSRFNECLTDNQKGDVKCYLAYRKDSRFISERLSSQEKAEFYVEADFSENDMRQCKSVQPLEGLLMARLGLPKWLISIMASANEFTVVSREHNFKAQVKYQLPSGSTSTTFRNSFWNNVIFRAWQNKYRIKGVAAFLGDDMIAKVYSSSFSKTKRGRKDASRSYEHIAKCARMVAKVKVHTHLMEAEFLSKNFVPSDEHGHLMIPKIGKAFGRFNVRASNNLALTDAEYIAGKALSYSWEFRFCTEVRDACAERAVRTGVDLAQLDLSAFSYNFRNEVSRVGSIKKVLTTAGNEIGLSWNDMENFCAVRYGVSWDETLELVLAVLFGSEDIQEIQFQPFARTDYW